jgi:hypothetical protein
MGEWESKGTCKTNTEGLKIAETSKILPRQYSSRSLINETLEVDVIAKIRHCVNTGLVLGTESFRSQVASMHK